MPAMAVQHTEHVALHVMTYTYMVHMLDQMFVFGNYSPDNASVGTAAINKINKVFVFPGPVSNWGSFPPFAGPTQ